ncbi:acetyl-CoA carboxylase biotin carboxyl carrier protein subunit [bacterium]|nr:acetyl-CoA carboxylase biotin carboxyl carrier protein subunit [bacterium]
MKLKITIENRIYEVDVEAFEPEPVHHHFSQHSGAAPPPPPAAAPEVSDKVGRSPVAGVVVRIPAQLGQSVQPGDPVVVLEAMKMETLITAAVAGKVSSVLVKIGETVQGGQVLFELE